MFAELLAECLDRTGKLTVAVSLVLGVIAGLFVGQFIQLQPGFWENAAIWVFIGGTVAFVLDLLMFAPLRLLRRERKAKNRQPSGVSFTGDRPEVHFHGEPWTPRIDDRVPGEPNHPANRSEAWRHESYIHDRKFQLTDLPTPRGILRNRVFERCTIVGPAMVVVGSGVVFSRVSWGYFGTPESILYVVDPDRQPALSGVIGIVDCKFIKVRFEGVGLVGDQATIDFLRGAVADGGLHELKPSFVPDTSNS